MSTTLLKSEPEEKKMTYKLKPRHTAVLEMCTPVHLSHTLTQNSEMGRLKPAKREDIINVFVYNFWNASPNVPNLKGDHCFENVFVDCSLGTDLKGKNVLPEGAIVTY